MPHRPAISARLVAWCLVSMPNPCRSSQAVGVNGSTEVGDVSRITPTGDAFTCCMPIVSPGHSWQIVAASASPVGIHGMDFAARTIALTGLELMTGPEALQAAREEFERATAGAFLPRRHREPRHPREHRSIVTHQIEAVAEGDRCDRQVVGDDRRAVRRTQARP